MKTIETFNDYIGYKVKIFPTQEQEKIFNQYFGTCRYVYNLGIDIQKKNIESTNRYLGFYSLNNEFTKIKHTEDYDWLNNFDSTCLKLVLKDLVNAYDFHRKNYKYYRKPRYKSKKKSKSNFQLDQIL